MDNLTPEEWAELHAALADAISIADNRVMIALSWLDSDTQGGPRRDGHKLLYNKYNVRLRTLKSIRDKVFS